MNNNYNQIKKIYRTLFLICLTIITSCKKFIDADLPIDKYAAETAFGNVTTVSSIMTGIYITMGRDYDGIVSSLNHRNALSLGLGLRADELRAVSGDFSYSYIFADNGSGYWTNTYGGVSTNYIYRLNSLIEGVSSSSTLPESFKTQIIGEAKFLRAFFYFYLVNLYGDVPLVISTDFKVNERITRTSKHKVYEQIIDDLKSAQTSLNNNYLESDELTSTNQRLRPNKAVATALLARVYLFTSQWQKAEQEASTIINNATYVLPTDLNDVFLIGSSEAIWQVQTPGVSSQFWLGDYNNTADGALFLSTADWWGDKLEINQNLLNSFEVNDNRKVNWTIVLPDGRIVPYKYKVGAVNSNTLDYTQKEFVVLFRLAEQYLIRAEARVEQGNIAGAQDDLNIIRARAGLPATAANDLVNLRMAILKERRVELFTEFGHRWLDLKRTGKLDEVMAAEWPVRKAEFPAFDQLPDVWEPYRGLFQVPITDLRANPNLTPNAGWPLQ